MELIIASMKKLNNLHKQLQFWVYWNLLEVKIICFNREKSDQQVGFNGGVPITVEFSMKDMTGKTNEQNALSLFPDWDQDQLRKLIQEKEALFER